MSKSSLPSDESLLTIHSYCDARRGISYQHCEPYKEIIVYLYSSMPFENHRVLAALSLYRNIPSHLISILQGKLDILQREYTKVINYCYALDASDGSLVALLHKLPSNLTALCQRITNMQDGLKVFLPYAGDAQFALEQPNCKFIGFEASNVIWAFSHIILQANGVKSNIYQGKEYGIDRFRREKFDCIFYYAPFAKDLVKDIYELTIYNLEKNGKLVCILPIKACSDDRWLKVRSLLDLNEKYSIEVVAIPDIFAPTIKEDICIIRLINDHKGEITLMDARDDSFYDTTTNAVGYKQIYFQISNIVENLHNVSTNKHVWRGTVTDLHAGYNLNPVRYLLHQGLPIPQEGESIIPLGDLIEEVTCRRLEVKEYRELSIGELSHNYLKSALNYANLPHEFRPISDKVLSQSKISNVLVEACLLVGIMDKTVKVGQINGVSNNHAIHLRKEILPFKIKKTEIITSQFLLRSLLDDYIKDQIKRLSIDTSTEEGKKELLQIQVLIPSLDKQAEICNSDLHNLVLQTEKSQSQSEEKVRKDMHMVKHAMAQTLLNFNNWWTLLLRARELGDGCINDQDVIGTLHPIVVSDIYTNMQNAINQLQHQISRFDRGNGMVAKTIALTDFIEQYINKHKSPIFRFQYDARAHRASKTINGVIEVGDPIEWVDFPPEALEIIFDNIISNAIAHGFSTESMYDNIININIHSEGNNYVLAISNNGKPLSQEMSNEDVFIYARSTEKTINNHFGIGGFEIKNLMKEFNGDADLSQNPKPNNDEATWFPVTYKLTFFKTNIVRNLI